MAEGGRRDFEEKYRMRVVTMAGSICHARKRDWTIAVIFAPKPQRNGRTSKIAR
jgi:hypothetical protein